MKRNYQYLALDMLASDTIQDYPYELDARGIYYKDLNENIRELSDSGIHHIVLKNVRGQRYIGDGIINERLLIEIEGVPGEDLGYGMGGPAIVVYGHAQNAVANTMDSGRIIIHGLAGDALAYGMRGGKLFVRDDVGYRVGIHMKAYEDKSPVVVAGRTAGDFSVNTWPVAPLYCSTGKKRRIWFAEGRIRHWLRVSMAERFTFLDTMCRNTSWGSVL